jgi:putative membrane protein
MTERRTSGRAVATQSEESAQVADPRVYLAAERTFLAWVRTSLALMGFGFLIARFALLVREVPGPASTPHPEPPAVTPWVGFFMVCFGVAVCLVSLVRHRVYLRALESGVANPPLNARAPLVIAAVLALVGLAMAVLIVTL